jgi:NAD-dependent deacetylase
MPVIARQSGAVIIEINPEPTPLTDRTSAFLIQGKAGPTVKKIVAEVERIMSEKGR